MAVPHSPGGILRGAFAGEVKKGASKRHSRAARGSSGFHAGTTIRWDPNRTCNTSGAVRERAEGAVHAEGAEGAEGAKMGGAWRCTFAPGEPGLPGRGTGKTQREGHNGPPFVRYSLFDAPFRPGPLITPLG